MALVQATGRLESAFNGWLSSGVATTANGSQTPQMLLGARRNMVSGFTDHKSAIPDGHLASSAYFIPQVAGNMSSINEANIVFLGAGNAAQGINLTGSTAITFAANGDSAAVAAAIGSSTITFAASGTAVAPLNAIGTSTITFAATGTIRADALAGLGQNYGEAPRVTALMTGGNMLIITAAPSGGWTALEIQPDGKACIVAAGEAFEVQDAPAPGSDS